MAVTTNKEIMSTEWYFSTPVYSIMKPDWLKPAIKATKDRQRHTSHE